MPVPPLARSFTNHRNRDPAGHLVEQLFKNRRTKFFDVPDLVQRAEDQIVPKSSNLV
jgi:hypothetical protein